MGSAARDDTLDRAADCEIVVATELGTVLAVLGEVLGASRYAAGSSIQFDEL